MKNVKICMLKLKIFIEIKSRSIVKKYVLFVKILLFIFSREKPLSPVIALDLVLKKQKSKKKLLVSV